ncbi:uncharacterized protein Dvir_GJ21119 [Drosophila virilis]|uniref:DUF4802 domain-containing protein n=1 Tax=Drosophila virilis TaxID=7244 RepID=B4LML1_DROVI|nr:uncharacterized protein Dvir_GJ21119 [Drosophila virilis]
MSISMSCRLSHVVLRSSDIQSLWLTSWFGSHNNNNNSSNSNSNSNNKNRRRKQQKDAGAVDAGVYTLQQPHKFPLQLDVYGGNCSFDYQQHELPSGHYQQQQQQQHRQRQLERAASAAQEQSTLSIQHLKQLKNQGKRQQEQQAKQWRFLRNSSDINETKFIESSAAQTMDDMVYQCSNQNSIYVLNAGYNPTYGEFGAHALAATGREMNGSSSSGSRTASNSIGASCSSAACSLQHKFKTFGTANGNSSAAAATAATPVATSMSTAMCSPATAALQKLFNCNVTVGGGGSIGDNCQNVSHRNQQQGHSNTNNNNNCPVGSHNNSCLSATASHRCRCVAHEDAANGTAIGNGNGSGCGCGCKSGCGSGNGVATAAGALPLLGAVANRKKCTNVKSTLIAKKTKFLKILEEEKWRSNQQQQQLTPDEAEACGATQQPSRANSNGADPHAAAASSFAAHSAGKDNNSNMKNHNSNNNNNNSQEAAGVGAGAGVGAEQQQNKLNNWSMHNDNNNKLANYTQQQERGAGERKLESYKQANRSSSYELYQEAAEILGLSCSLCDNCRCLDCQSGYFDCADDDDESYSEQSLMDEYDDEYDYGYGYEEQMLLPAGHTNQSAMTQAEGQRERDSEQEQQLELCYAVDCQQNCSKVDGPSESQESGSEWMSKSEQRLAIDFDLINATSSQVLENCSTFNDLSLLDAEQQAKPFT